MNNALENIVGTSDERNFHLTDSGNAERFASQNGQDVRFVHKWSKWLVWDETRWQPDAKAAVERMGLQTIRSIYNVAGEIDDLDRRKTIVKHAMNSEAVARRYAMIRLAQSEHPIPIEPSMLDTHPMLLNCQNGTLDLKTGKLREHRREDFLTKISPVSYDSSAEAPLWLSFLNRIFNGDRETVSFIQRLMGYCLTGDVGEQVLPIFFGKGANGKSTLVETIMSMLGSDYSAKAPRDLLLAKKYAHPTELTTLHGRRLMVTTETDDGRRLAEATVKESTGGDTITGRRMREDFWEFKPTHKFILSTNHKPEVRGTDYAIWRRLLLVPFSVTIPKNERDKALPEKLKGELPGILTWCLQGCLEWQRCGLQAPHSVLSATKAYKAEQDILSEFFQECCFEAPYAKTKSSELLSRYKSWANDPSMSEQKFGNMLTERGYNRTKLGGYIWRMGIGLLANNRHNC